MADLDPLAFPEDLEDRLGRALTYTEETRSEWLLADASAKVRGYTRRDFTRVDGDVQVLRPVGTLIRLPRKPVVAVHQVIAISGVEGIPDLPLPPGWRWDGDDLVDLDGLDPSVFVQLPEWWTDLDRAATSYRVTYDHGYDKVPADVVAVVAGMVIRTLTAISPTEGLVSERIGQYNYQMQQGMGSPGMSVRLTRSDKDDLARYRRTAGTVAVTVR